MSDDKTSKTAQAEQITRALCFDAAKITSAVDVSGNASELVISVLVDLPRLAAIELDLSDHKADVARFVDNPGALIDWATFFARRERLFSQEVVRLYAHKIEAPAHEALWALFPTTISAITRFS